MTSQSNLKTKKINLRKNLIKKTYYFGIKKSKIDSSNHDNLKYILCFRSTNHPHDALKEGVSPHGGKIGPIKYEGAIDTDTAIPLTPILDAAAFFPINRDSYDITTIDVLLIPLPKENDSILTSAIEKITSNAEFSASGANSDAEFVNASSIQKLSAIQALKTLSEKKDIDNNLIDHLMEIVYDELGGMIWVHELAVKKIERANVVASLKCQREINKFKITEIQLQDDEIVNKIFIEFNYKELLMEYLKKYTDEFRPIKSTSEDAAYHGYSTKDSDYTNVHKDIRYQFYLEQIQLYCDRNRIYLTHNDNLELMDSFEQPTFDIETFCSTLAKKNEYPCQDVTLTKNPSSTCSMSPASSIDSMSRATPSRLSSFSISDTTGISASSHVSSSTFFYLPPSTPSTTQITDEIDDEKSSQKEPPVQTEITENDSAEKAIDPALLLTKKQESPTHAATSFFSTISTTHQDGISSISSSNAAQSNSSSSLSPAPQIFNSIVSE